MVTEESYLQIALEGKTSNDTLPPSGTKAFPSVNHLHQFLKNK